MIPRLALKFVDYLLFGVGDVGVVIHLLQDSHRRLALPLEGIVENSAPMVVDRPIFGLIPGVPGCPGSSLLGLQWLGQWLLGLAGFLARLLLVLELAPGTSGELRNLIRTFLGFGILLELLD